MVWFRNIPDQNCEYTRVLNKNIFSIWICLGFWICQGSKDLRLHMVLSEILHHRYLALFWICLESWPWQFCFTHGSVENSLSCMFDRVMSIPGVLIMLGLEDTKTVNMSLLHMILFKLCFEDSWCFECLEF